MPIKVTSTTLALSVRELFQKFAEACSSPEGLNRPAIASWRATLANLEFPGTLEPLGILERSLRRLRQQVISSELLDREMQNVATGVIDGLDVLINPDFFGHRSQEIAQHCSPDRLGTLGMLATTLRLEFPEPIIPNDALSEILADINSVMEKVSDSDLPIDFQAMLQKRLSFLRWMVSNVRLFGIENTRDALGETMVLAVSIEAGTSQKPTKFVQLRDAILTMGGRLQSVISFFQKVDQGLTAIEHIKNDFDKLSS